MTDWKTIGKKLLCPPAWVMFLLTALSTAALVWVFVKGYDTHWISYVIYVLSFYTLCILCFGGYQVFPGWFRKIKKAIYANKFGNRYMTDPVFKTHVSLYRSLVINLLYVAVNVISYFLYRSTWFVILAVYYLILGLMRFLLLRYVNRNAIGQNLIKEFRRSRLCGYILMTVNLTLTGAVLMILYQNKGYEYHGMMIYVMAAYTFYITVYAIYSAIKYRKYQSPVMSTSKVISLSAALVSMLSLETAMLSAFGSGEDPRFRRIMIAATGAGVSVIVLAMSVYIILRANREIRRAQEKE